MHDRREDVARILEALSIWAAGHPAADQPFLIIMGRTFTPKEFLHEVKDQTEFGRPFLDYLFEEAARRGIEPAEPIYRAIDHR